MGTYAGEPGEGVEDLIQLNKGKPLDGIYHGQKFVYVYGEKSEEELRFLGSYGTEYQEVTRKDPSRTGPSNRQIAENVPQDEIPTTILTQHEAFFLCHALGCITIRTTPLGHPLSPKSCWDMFRNYSRALNSSIDFAVEYAVYFYYRSRGWVVKDGINFGVDFLLYKQGPTIDHAYYAVKIFCNHGPRSDSNKWITLLTLHRVTQSVGKELLLSYVTIPDPIVASLDQPNCIRSMLIVTRSFKANANAPVRSSYLMPSIKSEF